MQSPTPPLVGAADASHGGATTIERPVDGAVTPDIPTLATAASNADENVVTSLSVERSVEDFVAGTESIKVASSAMVAVDGEPRTPSTSTITLSAALRTTFTRVRFVIETSYVKAIPASSRRPGEDTTFEMAVVSTFSATASAVLNVSTVTVDENVCFEDTMYNSVMFRITSSKAPPF